MNRRGLGILEILGILIAFSVLAFLALVIVDDFKQRKALLEENYNYSTTDALLAWNNMLGQLDYDADIAFIGDSIISTGNFQSYFPQYRIINLGVGGDTIEGVSGRLQMAATAAPEKLFILAGINVLRDDNISDCVSQYNDLLATVAETVPSASIYVISVLPVSEDWQSGLPCSEETIVEFNTSIKGLAEARGMTYIDVHSSYLLSGQMNPSLSSDGVHPSDYEPFYKTLEKWIKSKIGDGDKRLK